MGHILGRVFKRRWNDLLVVIILTIVAIIIGALVMFLLEGFVCYEPNAFESTSIFTNDGNLFVCNPGFRSVPIAMYWATITLTTVGYGDIYPATILGMIFTCFFAIVAIGIGALPVGILGAGYVE